MDLANEELKSSLKERHYLRKAKPPNYWFDFSVGPINQLIEKYGDDFLLIIYGDDAEILSDYYAIPYSIMKGVLVDDNKDAKRERWIGDITNHYLKIKNSSLNIEKYHNTGLAGIVDSNFDELFENIIKFVEQAQTTDLKTKDYIKQYNDLDVKVSFGRGNQTNVPWICFLKDGETVQQGYYPSIYYDKEISVLFTVMGVSETNKSLKNWPTNYAKQYETFAESSKSENIKKLFPSSHVFEEYNIEITDIKQSLANYKNSMKKALEELIRIYTFEDQPTLKKPDFNLLLKKKQIILYGPPGTGKTYNTMRQAVEIIIHGDGNMVADSQDAINKQYEELKENGQIEFITFHPSYCYEEFVEGITIDVDNSGKPTDNLKYKLKQGIFKKMVIKALYRALDSDKVEKVPENISLTDLMKEYRNEVVNTNTKEWWKDKPKFVLIIDEINRGDISKIFGELITLLEADKRLGMENELTVRLPYSQEEFGVPPNLYIIGTMNTADKSIALIDIALRRRFGFIEKAPDLDLLKAEYIDKNQSVLEDNDVYDGLLESVKALKKINDKICQDPSVGRDRQIGHSFLFKAKTKDDLIMVWKNEILPLLEEYYYGQYSRIKELLFDKDQDTPWVNQQKGISDFENYKSLLEFLEEVNKQNRVAQNE